MGMKFAEYNCLSLANKIHDTEINHEIDNYLDDLRCPCMRYQ